MRLPVPPLRHRLKIPGLLERDRLNDFSRANSIIAYRSSIVKKIFSKIERNMEKAGQSSWSLGNREVFRASLPTLNPKVNIRKTAAFAAALTY